MIRILLARPHLHAILVVCLAAMPACSAGDGPQPSTGPQGSLVGHGDCRSGTGKAAQGNDCIQYAYDGDGVLQIRHRNAAFNCCPTKIEADVSVADGVIRIEEREIEPSCRCLCVYDVDYEIRHLPPGAYRLVLTELYLEDGDERLDFSIDLTATPSDTLCVPRDHYPWETGDAHSVTIVGAAGHKSGVAREGAPDPPAGV